MKNYSISKKVQEAGLVLGAFGVIGFIGIVWLMIYGNLSGNLGFGTLGVTNTVTNETLAFANLTGYTLSGYNSTWSAITPTAVWEVQDGLYNVTVPLANVSISNTTGVLTNATTQTYANVSVSYTYVHTYNSQGLDDTNNVINNVTAGFLTFFGFSGTWFTIAAIVLLIFMLVGLLAIVMNIVAMQNKTGGKYSNY